MKNIQTVGHAKFWKDDNNIINLKFNSIEDYYIFDLSAAKKYASIITDLCNGRPMSFIIDLRGFHGTFSTEAANFIAKSSDLIKLRISEAFILNSIGTKLLIASYKRIYDPLTPHITCNDIETATQYCIENSDLYDKGS
ncbi:hypothetical protein [Olleya sp. UBA1516]|uniref:DUF7793 family protein n=1 Tax=Olleya sp. UBA1516 TaxID=1947013 RepID=UPI0025E47ADF|nr:hypothetical protein [Olleya sp. UBA1516]|tara:strand:+ start:7545 stop:7961 length:417 start_codon:yes stop_codon:yes gene_type:complete